MECGLIVQIYVRKMTVTKILSSNALNSLLIRTVSDCYLPREEQRVQARKYKLVLRVEERVWGVMGGLF